LTLGELHLRDYIAHPMDTNHLAEAQSQFDELLADTNTSPSELTGKAYLDRGWCFWVATNYPASLADFGAAARSLPFSKDLAVAKFKAGDALLTLGKFSEARQDYESVLSDLTKLPEVGRALGEQALYQCLRANLALNDAPGANATLARILKTYPEGDLSDNAILLVAESVDDSSQPSGAADARRLLEQFEKQFPNSELLPQARLAVAQTYEQDTNWPAAITNYEGWLTDFPTNSLRPQAEYALALANYQAGNETNALAEFTAFIESSTNEELAPLAQWWVADHFFRAGNWIGAETNYEAVYQNPAWKNSPLYYPAQLMAGRAAMARQGFPDANRYFTSLRRTPTIQWRIFRRRQIF
jgi:outer membrane protein assembly factor BamD (BamD/ComL family)